jgi:hypothetical protein
LSGEAYRTGTPSFPEIVPITRKKNLTRRANQGHINIIARTDKARAEKSAAGFLIDVFQSDGGRTSRRLISQPVT